VTAGSVPPRRVDVHTHAVPTSLPDLAERFPGAWPTVAQTGPCAAELLVGGRFFRALDSRCWDAARRVEEMDAEQVEVQVLSPIPVTLGYGLPVGGAELLAHVQNDWIAGLVREVPTRFRGLGTVPLQAPHLAAEMVSTIVRDLGLSGVEIASNVDGAPLDDPSFDEVYAACAEVGAVVFVHPWQVLGRERLRDHGLLYSVGMPSETAAAAATLMLGGVLDRHPTLRVVLAHGGGSLLSLLPRMQRCVEMLPGLTAPQRPLADYLRRFWYDSLVYDPVALRTLVAAVGADRVMVGTDYPFAIAERPAGAGVLAAALDAGEESAVLSGTARELFGLPAAAG
jgi:aminocarboxymuconate-semialdehyde decarboxylase